MNGVVIKTTGKRYTVKTEDGEVVQCRLKGKFRIAGITSTNPVVVGDKVEAKKESELNPSQGLFLLLLGSIPEKD